MVGMDGFASSSSFGLISLLLESVCVSFLFRENGYIPLFLLWLRENGFKDAMPSQRYPSPLNCFLFSRWLMRMRPSIVLLPPKATAVEIWRLRFLGSWGVFGTQKAIGLFSLLRFWICFYRAALFSSNTVWPYLFALSTCGPHYPFRSMFSLRVSDSLFSRGRLYLF